MPNSTHTLAPAATLHVGDALQTLTTLLDKSIDAVITDPPYAIKRLPADVWTRAAAPRRGCNDDSCRPTVACEVCERADQIEKFSHAAMLGQQSQNWHAKETHSRGYADNDPRQFQTWCALWLAECLRVLKPGGHLIAFGGTRTWHRLAVAAEDTGFEVRDSLAWIYSSGMPKSLNVQRALTGNAHDVNPNAWEGWGTSLKPAFEPIVLARRPLEGTMVNNIATWGVGALNLAHGRPRAEGETLTGATAESKWPSNVHLDPHQAEWASTARDQDAARFFWVSKPGKAERVVIDGVAHPTVKPIDLMRRLVRLVTPAEGVVLDPFAGSGTTFEACLLEKVRVVGVERDPAYVPLIKARVARQDANQNTEAASGPTGASDGPTLTLF